MSSAPKLSRAKRSAIWAYFHEEGSSSVKCKLCAAKLARQSGTTNLFNHLKAHHKVQYLEAVGGPVEVAAAGDSGDKKTSAGTKPLMSFFAPGQVRTCDKTRVGFITEMIVDWIVASVRPLSTVADTGLIEFFFFFFFFFFLQYSTYPVAETMQRKAAQLASKGSRSKQRWWWKLATQPTWGLGFNTTRGTKVMKWGGVADRALKGGGQEHHTWLIDGLR